MMIMKLISNHNIGMEVKIIQLQIILMAIGTVLLKDTLLFQWVSPSIKLFSKSCTSGSKNGSMLFGRPSGRS